jgi:tRNA A-37 threonylcarbamoyl transferase component Bud32
MRVVHAAGLSALKREPELPFELALPDATFTVTEVLRHLPGRRLTVGVADPARGSGVLKLFFGKHHDRDIRRALRGQEGLTRANVRTTPVIARGSNPAPGPGVEWLLFERLPDVTHATEVDAIELAGILGRLHFNGFSHTDLHLGNFLKTQRGELIAIDADAIEPVVLSVRSGLKELAILLAQFDIPVQPDVQACLDAYLAARQETTGLFTLARIRRLLAAAITQRSSHYLLKALRDCTNFMVREDGRGSARRRIYCRREEHELFEQFASDPELFFGETADILKRGNSATVVNVVFGRRKLVAKRYNITGITHRIRRVFRRRAREAWQSGLRLGFLGIPTALPIGLVETGRWWWPGPAYLLMERRDGKDLATLTRSGFIDSFTLKDLVNIMSALQKAGLAHGDLKSTNFLLHHGRLYLIDVDSIHVSDRGQRRDVQRLLGNWATDAPVHKTVTEALRQAGLKGV